MSAAPLTDTVTLARFFRVLAHPTRLRLLAELERGERTVSELIEAVGGVQARVSTHLACLRHCGFVTTERRGRQVVYRLSMRGLDDVVKRATSVNQPIAHRLASCSRVGPAWV